MSAQERKTHWEGRHLSMVASGQWEYVTRNTRQSAVGIVAVTDDRKVILVEQFRPPVGRQVIELPAGLAGDRPGDEDEPLIEAAKRELFEETGYQAAHWTRLVLGYSSPGLTDESIVLFLAQGLTKVADGGGDEHEAITIHEVELDHVLQWLSDRDAQADLKLLAGLYAAQRALA